MITRDRATEDTNQASPALAPDTVEVTINVMGIGIEYSDASGIDLFAVSVRRRGWNTGVLSFAAKLDTLRRTRDFPRTFRRHQGEFA